MKPNSDFLKIFEIRGASPLTDTPVCTVNKGNYISSTGIFFAILKLIHLFHHHFS